jgi:hypothetical protein
VPKGIGYNGKKKKRSKAKQMSSEEEKAPGTKIEAEARYQESASGIGFKPKPKPKPKEPGAVTKFGRYLKGKAKDIGETYKATDKYFAEKWKQESLKKEIEEKKKKAKIARLKAKGRKMRNK